MAIDESAHLAAARGAYKNFPGSGWSKGMVPIDSLEALEADRGASLKLDKTSHHRGLDWDILREKVKSGMRNATLMAVAPNANIGLLAGTVPGMDARFSQVFSRNKFSGKYLDINHNLVKDLKILDIWEDVKEQIIENRGDISQIEVIPQHIRDVYKTSFTNSPYAYVEVAARAQKWFDQAISRNIYLETRDIDETMQLYTTAWEKGLKSTYYLHMKPRHNAEQSTTRVNKAEIIGKKGFSNVFKFAPEAAPAVAGTAGFGKLALHPPELKPAAPKAEELRPEPVALEVSAIPEAKVEPAMPAPPPKPMGFAQVPLQPKPAEPASPAASAEGEKPKYNIIVSDPGDDTVCDSCQ